MEQSERQGCGSENSTAPWSPLDVKTPPPPFPEVKAVGIAGEHKKKTESSPRESSDEDELDDGKKFPTSVIPEEVVPPPPLRKIPHQKPDVSPTTSQLFSPPGSWSSQSQVFLQHTTKKLQPKSPTKICVVSKQSMLNRTPVTEEPQDSLLGSFNLASHLSNLDSIPRLKGMTTEMSEIRSYGISESRSRISLISPAPSTFSPFSDDADDISDEGLQDLRITAGGNTFKNNIKAHTQRVITGDGGYVRSTSPLNLIIPPSHMLQHGFPRHSICGTIVSEERDNFVPVMKQRSLPLIKGPGSTPDRPKTLPPLECSILAPTVGMPAVLPPIRSRSNISLSRSLTKSSHTLTKPPSYHEASKESITHVSASNRGGPWNICSHMGTMADITQDISKSTIHLSAMTGVHASEMRIQVLQHGVDYKDMGGRTPLMYAILGNQPKLCEALMKLKANVNIQDGTGFTPLLWATFHARPDIMKTLLKNGARVEIADKDGRSAFHWAMRTPNINCLKYLCKLACTPELINQRDNEYLTPLHLAVMSNQDAHVRMLLATSKADITAQDKEGRAPLNYAVLNYSASCIRAILNFDEAATNLIDDKGRTALHYACANNSTDCVRAYLTYKSCNIQCMDQDGTTPLHWAAASNQPKLVQLLLRRGADKYQMDSSGYTPVDYAQQRNYTDCVRILQEFNKSGSVLLIPSHASMNVTKPPMVDEHGHVNFKGISRCFSLSDERSVLPIDRSPADGQAQAEHAINEEQSHLGVEKEVKSETVQGSPNIGLTEQQGRGRRQRSWLANLFCCGNCAKRNNSVVPV